MESARRRETSFGRQMTAVQYLRSRAGRAVKTAGWVIMAMLRTYGYAACPQLTQDMLYSNDSYTSLDFGLYGHSAVWHNE